MMLLWLLLPFLAQGALGGDLFRKEPESRYVVRQGQSVTLECVTRQSSTCAWKLETPDLGASGFISANVPGNLDITARDPGSDTDCTITINNIDRKYDGIYTCSPYTTSGAQEDARPAEVIVARKPASLAFTGDAAGQRELEASVETSAAITCEAVGARPKAELTWYLGTRQIYEGIVVEDIADEQTKLVTSRSTLSRQYKRDDNGKLLRCLANHRGYIEQDAKHEVEIVVDVQYAPYRPQGNSIGKIYGFTAEEKGEITVNFTANPPPQQISWKVGDSTAVSVGAQSLDGRFTSSQLETMDAEMGKYSLTLTINPIKLEDQSKTFELRLKNAVGESKLDFSVGTGPAPPPPVVGAGAIAAIVIGVIVLLLIIGLVAFGRSQGKWCFAGKTATDRPKPARARPVRQDQQGQARRRSLAASSASLGSMGGGAGSRAKPGMFKMPMSYRALKQSLSARPNRERLDMTRDEEDVEQQGTEEVTYTNEQNTESGSAMDLTQVYANEPPPAKRPETTSSRDPVASNPDKDVANDTSSWRTPGEAPNMSTLPQTPLSPITPIEFPTRQTRMSRESEDQKPQMPSKNASNQSRPQSQSDMLFNESEQVPMPMITAQPKQRYPVTQPQSSQDSYLMQNPIDQPARQNSMPNSRTTISPDSVSARQRAPLGPPSGPGRYSEGFPYPAPALPLVGSREELGIPYSPAAVAPPLPPKARPLSQIPPGAVRILPSQLQSEMSARFPSSPSLIDPESQRLHGSQV